MERGMSLIWCCIFISDDHFFYRVAGNSEGDALKKNLFDPNNALESWDPTLVNPCTWLHVTCNGQNSVIRVDLGNTNLSGQLVRQLGNLANLQYLELYSNNITGTIPEELGNLTNLVSLDLFLNGLEGRIPATLGKLQRLCVLRLNNNNISGSIPMSLTTIASLQVLDLSSNQLTGDIPVNGSFALFTPISFANNPLNNFPVSPPLPLPPPPSSTHGITCETVSTSIDKCMPYVRNDGGVAKACCDGIKALPAKAKTTSDRRMICKCLKSLAASLPRLQPLRLANLPNKCGAEYPYNFFTATNCNNFANNPLNNFPVSPPPPPLPPSPPSTHAMTCETVSTRVAKCMPYVRNGGGVTKACCTGIKSLGVKARTASDRRMVCKCLKSLAASLSGLQPARVANLPNKCGVLAATNCNK